MTQLVKSESDRSGGPNAGGDADHDAQDIADPEEIADRIRDRSEQVRRRELETALERLRASGDVTPAECRTLTVLSARLTDALVERWASKLTDDGVDPTVALELLADKK